MRKLIWNFYADLKVYRANPDKSRRLALRGGPDASARHCAVVRSVTRTISFVPLWRCVAKVGLFPGHFVLQ